MAICTEISAGLIGAAEVHSLISRAFELLRQLKFNDAGEVISRACHLDIHAESWLAAGQIQMSRGHFSDAIPLLERALENARYQLSPLSRQRACFQLSDCYAELEDGHLALQYRSLAIAAVMEEQIQGGHCCIPEELRLINALQQSRVAISTEVVGELESILEQSTCSQFRGRVALHLSEMCSGNRRQDLLCEAWQHFLKAGDVFHAVSAIESLATEMLSNDSIEEGYRLIQTAQALATLGEMHSRSVTLGKIRSRLRISMNLLQEEFTLN